MAAGWIKLHRKILDCSLWDHEPANKKSAWIDLLLLVNHKDNQVLIDGRQITIKAGQKWTSIHKLADQWHWSVNRVKRYLSALETAHMITVKSNTNGTLITIVNYGFYQGMRHSDEYTNEYTDEYTDGHQTRMNKNIKKERKTPLNDDEYDENVEILKKYLGGT